MKRFSSDVRGGRPVITLDGATFMEPAVMGSPEGTAMRFAEIANTFYQMGRKDAKQEIAIALDPTQ